MESMFIYPSIFQLKKGNTWPIVKAHFPIVTTTLSISKSTS